MAWWTPSIISGSCDKYLFFSSRQRFCHVFCRDKSRLVVTKVLSGFVLFCFCRDKTFVTTNICCDKITSWALVNRTSNVVSTVVLGH